MLLVMLGVEGVGLGLDFAETGFEAGIRVGVALALMVSIAG